MITRVACYLRVSTEDQAREGYSIPAQRDRLMAFAKSQGWDAVEVYVDDGHTGASLDRPALTRLRADAKAKRFDTVLVWKVDRFSRKVSHLAALVEELDAAGVGFRSATEPFDTSHAAGRAFMQMLSVFAELERETIRERSKMWIRQRVKEGYLHGRPTPFGYRRTPAGGWEIEDGEAEVVRYIFRRYREGAGVTRIAQELAASSWPVPAAKRNGPHYDRLTSLQDRVRWMLDNPVYAGFAPLGQELFSGRHPAIIQPEEWQAVQALRKGERAVPNRAKRSTYPLSGLAKCGECGRSMSGFRQPNRSKNPAVQAARPFYVYYVCTGGSNLRGRAKACTNWGMMAERVEEEVAQALRQLHLDAQALDQAAEAEVAATAAAEETTSLAKLRRRLALIRRRREKWFRAFEEDDALEAAARDRLRELADEEQFVARAIADEEAKQAPRQGLDRQAALHMLGNLDQILPLFTPDERRQFYRLFVREVRVFKDKHVEVDTYPL